MGRMHTCAHKRLAMPHESWVACIHLLINLAMPHESWVACIHVLKKPHFYASRVMGRMHTCARTLLSMSHESWVTCIHVLIHLFRCRTRHGSHAYMCSQTSFYASRVMGRMHTCAHKPLFMPHDSWVACIHVLINLLRCLTSHGLHAYMCS